MQGRTRARKIRTPRKVAATILAAFAAAIVLASCSSESRFGAYEGVNLVSAYSLGTDWVPDYNTASSPSAANSGGIYMTYEDSGETYNGAPAYRLRTVNLFPNGDFEDVTKAGTHADWLNSDATYTSYSVATTDVIQGSYSLTCRISNQSALIYFPLDSLADAFPEKIPYTFRFSLAYLDNKSNAAFEINGSTVLSDVQKTLSLANPSGAADTTFTYPDDFTDSPFDNTTFRNDAATPLYFYLNTLSVTDARGPQSVSLDKIRFLRSDLGYKIRLKLFRTAAGRLELLSGTYRLSVYVKQDPNAGASNVFPASRISLGINRTYDSVTKTFLDDGSKGIAATSDWSGWTQVSATFKNVQVDTYGSAYPCLELTISATDSAGDATRDVGSILISSPSLEFLPDG